MIIDAHAHIGLDGSLSKSMSMILRSQKLYHIEYSLIMNGRFIEHQGKHQKRHLIDQVKSGQEAIAFARQHPHHLGVLLWCNPAHETVNDDFITLIKTNRDIIFGLKFHPWASKLPMHHPRYEPYFALARDLHLPILFHTAVDEFSSILFLAQVAKKYPDLTFIAAHLELLSDHKTAIKVLKENPNIYADTAWVPLDIALKVMKTIGPNRILFGSDNPIDGVHTLNHAMYQSYYQAHANKRISKKRFDLLMAKNAIAVYQLPINME